VYCHNVHRAPLRRLCLFSTSLRELDDFLYDIFSRWYCGSIRLQCACFVYFYCWSAVCFGFGYGYGRKWAISFAVVSVTAITGLQLRRHFRLRPKPEKTGFGRSLNLHYEMASLADSLLLSALRLEWFLCMLSTLDVINGQTVRRFARLILTFKI